MQVTTKTAAILVVTTVLGTIGAAWAMPTVSNVELKQTPNSRQVQITYDLGVEDAIVTLSIKTNGVALPDTAVTRLTGYVNKVVATGIDKSIQWNAGIDWPQNVNATAKAQLTAWCTNAPPQIMVIDLSSGEDAETYPLSYYTSVAALPGGVTNAIYKSAYLVMRKINQGEFSMGTGIGSTLVAVTLTNDFYMGVFPVTQRQWSNIMGSSLAAQFIEFASRSFRPMEQVSYDHIRGANAGAGWPGSNEVEDDSFVGRLRARAQSNGFDLPTEAQWEYACRAGTGSYYNDGEWDANELGDNAITNSWIDALGRYKGNGGVPDGGYDKYGGPDQGTAIVGSYKPNSWGLYDMHGNVSEWCLDWYVSQLTGGLNPVGPSTGGSRIARGGSWAVDAQSCGSASRSSREPDKTSNHYGFRLVRNLH